MPRAQERGNFPLHFSNPGFLKAPWAGGTPGDGRAQARRAAQAQRGQGKWRPGSSEWRRAQRRPGCGCGCGCWCGCGARRRAGDPPQESWGRGRALPTRGAEGQCIQDGRYLLAEVQAALHAGPPSEGTGESFGRALVKPEAAHACSLQTRVCAALTVPTLTHLWLRVGEEA